MIAGTDHITLADLAIMASYTPLRESGIIDLSKYSNVEQWYFKCKKLIPNYEKANGEGAAEFGRLFKSKK